ncbi:MAG: hypothetical protein HY866_11500 [Chloroflexi bacterium]|nr:hypothetical protein [Chloroflexota bacterium]
MIDQTVYLGVDGGGSKTAALVIDAAGNILGVGSSGGSNYQTIGMETARKNLQEATAQALNGRRAAVGVFCLSGADMLYDFNVLDPVLRELNVCDDIHIYNDSLAIFRAGSSKPYGVAVVCGTGFNAAGVSREGVEFRLPALGNLTGDQNTGGGGLGILVLGAAFRAWDGRGENTVLHKMVLDTLQAPDMPTLAEWLVQERISFEQMLSLAPLAFAAAAQGDEIACAMIREQGEEVARTILAFLRRLDLLEVDCEAVLGGSMFYGQGSLLMDTIHARVNPTAPHLTIKRLDVKPVVGAALFALDHAGLNAPELRSRLPEELRITLG